MMYWEFVLRVFLSLLLGFVIGLERELTGHPAGIRINVLIALGTSLFTLFPILYGSEQVFRVGASIISGVGFLCSGVIFKDSGSVRGINTAATLWCTAAIGVLSSTGKVLIAVTATIILVLSNVIFRFVVRKIKPYTKDEVNEQVYKISITCEEDEERNIRLSLLKGIINKNVYLTYLKSGDAVGNKVEIIAKYGIKGKFKNSYMEDIVSSVLKNDAVVSAGWELI